MSANKPTLEVNDDDIAEVIEGEPDETVVDKEVADDDLADDKVPSDDDLEDEPEEELQEVEEEIVEDEKPKPKPKPDPVTDPETKAAPVEETEETVAAVYDKAISVADANVRLLKDFMDGTSTIKGRDGKDWTPYEEMTPSQRREVDKLLTRNERESEAYSQQKHEKVAAVRSAREMVQLDNNVKSLIAGVAQLKPEFKGIDEGTSERLEARYFRLLRSGRMPSMTDQQIVDEVTKGITPVKAPVKGAPKKAAPHRNSNTVRSSDSTFRVRVEKDPPKADPKAAGKYSPAALDKLNREYISVMGYQPSPGAEPEDLEAQIKFNKRNRKQ